MITSLRYCVYSHTHMHQLCLQNACTVFSLTVSVYIDREVLVITYEYDLKTELTSFSIYKTKSVPTTESSVEQKII